MTLQTMIFQIFYKFPIMHCHIIIQQIILFLTLEGQAEKF